MDFTNEVLIYQHQGDRADRARANIDDDFIVRHGHHHLVWHHRAPDETAYGDWMKLVATMGLQWDKALLQYLLDGNRHRAQGTSFFGGAAMSLDRPRPPKPESAAATKSLTLDQSRQEPPRKNARRTSPRASPLLSSRLRCARRGRSVAPRARSTSATVPPGSAAGSNVCSSRHTLRADRRRLWQRSGLTPTLDRLAIAASLRIAYTPVPMTLPAHAAILTGLSPSLGITNTASRRSDPHACHDVEARIPDRAFVGALVLNSGFGLDRDFDVSAIASTAAAMAPQGFPLAERLPSA
jgi:hypothetical protein